MQKSKLTKVLCLVLSFMMILCAAPLTSFAAEPVKYLYREWNEATQKVKNSEKEVADYTVMSSSSTTLANGGWYVVNNKVDVDSAITLADGGTAYIILADGAKLTATAGIVVKPGQALVIYGQAGDTGILNARGGSNAAGIGGSGSGSAGGTITIYGGIIEVEGGMYGAGIGGAQRGAGGTVTVYGGTVTAKAGKLASGIGGGQIGAGGTLTVYGGTVTASTSSPGATGIGTGTVTATTDAGTVTINGGTVTAQGGSNGAGIGGGNNCAGGTVTINGGTVIATGGDYGAGIGGGQKGAGGTVSINGGSVTATGGNSAAGIGGGYYTTTHVQGTLTVSDKATIIAGDSATSAAKVVNETFSSNHSARYVNIEMPAHTHGFAGVWSSDAAGHWHACTATGCDITNYATCGLAGAAYAAHTWENGKCTVCEYVCDHNGMLSGTCEICGMWLFHIHGYTPGAWETDATSHWYICTQCNQPILTENHTWENGKCAVCDYECDHNGMLSGTCEICGETIYVSATIPTAVTGLVYNTKPQTGVAEGRGYTVAHGKATAAGTYTAVATLKDGYKWADGSTEDKEIVWSIAKCPLDVPTAKTGLVYTGNLVKGVTTSVTGIQLQDNIRTNAGTYTATATLDSNYEWTDGTTSAKEISYTIAPAAVSLENPEVVTRAYNGTTAMDISFSGISGVKGSDSISVTGLTGTAASANAADEVTVTVSGGTVTGEAAANYTLVLPEALTGKITKRPVTLVASSAEKTFDDTMLTSPGYTVKADTTTADYGFIPGEGIDSLAMTEDSYISEVGSVANVIDKNSIIAKAGTNLGNYEITCENGTLTINDVPAHIHEFDVIWSQNAAAHWHACTADGCDIEDYATVDDSAYGAHTDANGDFYCDICNYYDEEAAAAAALAKAKAEAIDALKAAAGDDCSDEVAEILGQYTGQINGLTNVNTVNALKNDGVNAINTQIAKEKLDAAKKAAVNTLNGLVDEAGDEIKADAGEIADAAKGKIASAENIADVDKALKEASDAIAALMGTTPDEPEAGDCPYCGRTHRHFFDWLVCLINRIINMIRTAASIRVG